MLVKAVCTQHSYLCTLICSIEIDGKVGLNKGAKKEVCLVLPNEFWLQVMNKQMDLPKE